MQLSLSVYFLMINYEEIATGQHSRIKHVTFDQSSLLSFICTGRLASLLYIRRKGDYLVEQ